MLPLLLSLLVLCTDSRAPWDQQLGNKLCMSDSRTVQLHRELTNSGFHKDLITHFENVGDSSVLLLENITSDFYIDLDQIREGLFLGMPPVFADHPIDTEQSAELSPSHTVGVVCQTQHVTIPVHHRYQVAGSAAYHTVCLPSPRVFLPVVTQEVGDTEGEIIAVESSRGCMLLRAPCGTTPLPLCGWEEVLVEGSEAVCSAVPSGLLQHITLVQISTVLAVLVGLFIVINAVRNKHVEEKKED